MHTALAETVAVKPTTPLHVSIIPESAVTPGNNASFVVRVSSALASNNLVISVNQPEGAELLSGELQWSGSIAQGEVRELRFALRLPERAVPVINVIATIQSASGAQLAATDTYRQSVAMPAGLKVAPGRTVSRHGHPVVEYSLK
ncbi:hypothetical protein [Kaarinaea lacus]